MLASLGCFFAHLSYSLRTARLAPSFFMLATQRSFPMFAVFILRPPKLNAVASSVKKDGDK
jgi:hypothetical protein